jgi:hypothetical protein
MRTTVRIDDELLRLAKRRAAQEGRTLTSLIESGLSLVLSISKPTPRKRVELPVSKASGGVLSGVDLNRSETLEEIMESS